MYPPLAGDDGAHSFWKKHVIRTNGKVLNRKVFTGNIIVEKIEPQLHEADVDQNYHQNLIFR